MHNENKITSDIKAFEISYSDDILYLQEIRETYLTHPFFGKGEDKFLFDPCCCRLLSILIVGNIEMLAKAWYERTNISGLNDLYSKKHNCDKLKSFKELLDDYNISSEKYIIEKYLAIKNLRNALIHSDLGKNKKDMLQKNNLPSDIQKLDETTWNLFLEVNNRMMLYLNQIGLYKKNLSEQTKESLIKQRSPMVLFDILEEIQTYGENEFTTYKLSYEHSQARKAPRFMTKNNLRFVLWNNIEDIYNYIGDSNQEKINYVSLIEDTLTTWDFYISIVYPKYKNISIKDMLDVINIIKIYIDSENPVQLNNIPDKKLLDALKQTRMMDIIIKTTTILGLFIYLLENIDCEKNTILLNETKKIILAVELKIYYDFIRKPQALNNKFLETLEQKFHDLEN
ncbi:MAG: hypothetical protein LKF87_14915 [Clostridium tyrobutyricum]|uniref:hypothetical protein n=1 Tax=Clostridium tyrobutyricum TaxID=1519 RepID=UPI0011CA1D06|nr:hypothetical protein [Clostridium tyrobutyricum]MCH4200726.1 hypothetical protein [Clostridium tyrobutyricum]MCH4260206.1 hypothetical protein [Clostridium tyrobutyricum]